MTKKPASRDGSASAKRVRSAQPDGIRTTWKESRLFCGPYPEQHKRFFGLETLTSAVERLLNQHDRFLHAELSAHLGPAPLSTVSGDLLFEDANRLLFAVEAANRARKRVLLHVCVAKNHEECSAALFKEFEALVRVYPRAPQQVLRPLRMGTVFLPDRYRRKHINREVRAYITEPAPGGPLYVASPNQLGPRGPRPVRFSIADTESLKLSLVRLAATCYDVDSGTGLDPADLTANAVTLRKRTDGKPDLFLMHCPRLRRRLRPEQLIHRLLAGAFKSNRHILPLAPVDPERFVESLADGASPPVARAWCRAFLGSVRKAGADQDESLPGRAYLAQLAECAQASRGE